MVKKRLIYVLLYKNGKFCLSRNFRKQYIGDKKWLFNNYNFGYVSKYIDELVILNVEDERSDISRFRENVEFVLNNVFVPVALGGGIDSFEKAQSYFDFGADKIIVNTALHDNPELVNTIANVYGKQAVIASIDFKDDKPYIKNGTQMLDCSLSTYLHRVQQLAVGEIMLNSINKDGTGFGFDVDFIKQLIPEIKVPLIISGGAGHKNHFLEVANLDGVEAFSTANLLNFIGEALPNSRKHLLANQVPLGNFDVSYK
ncbi:MAG: HisA/HisF-related TIM barrel protein [Bacteroidota bacterium]